MVQKTGSCRRPTGTDPQIRIQLTPVQFERGLPMFLWVASASVTRALDAKGDTAAAIARVTEALAILDESLETAATLDLRSSLKEDLARYREPRKASM